VGFCYCADIKDDLIVMKDSMSELSEKRFQFLHRLYELSGGNQNELLEERDIGEELNLTSEQSDIIGQYLEGEDLIKYVSRRKIAITHNGVVEIENALSAPNEPSHYFPPVNIINIQHMEGSQIQQGTIDSVQQGAFSVENEKQLSEFIGLLKTKLHELEISGDDKSEIESDIATIEAQIKSNRPKSGIIKESLLSIKRILKGASEAVIATGLLEYLRTLLGG